MAGVTLDAGGLIALDRDDRRVVVLLARARETGARVTVPATVLAQALIREGLRNVAAGANTLGLRKGIDKAVKAAVDSIKEQ